MGFVSDLSDVLVRTDAGCLRGFAGFVRFLVRAGSPGRALQAFGSEGRFLGCGFRIRLVEADKGALRGAEGAVCTSLHGEVRCLAFPAIPEGFLCAGQ